MTTLSFPTSGVIFLPSPVVLRVPVPPRPRPAGYCFSAAAEAALGPRQERRILGLSAERPRAGGAGAARRRSGSLPWPGRVSGGAGQGGRRPRGGRPFLRRRRRRGRTLEPQRPLQAPPPPRPGARRSVAAGRGEGLGVRVRVRIRGQPPAPGKRGTAPGAGGARGQPAAARR